MAIIKKDLNLIEMLQSLEHQENLFEESESNGENDRNSLLICECHAVSLASIKDCLYDLGPLSDVFFTSKLTGEQAGSINIAENEDLVLRALLHYVGKVTKSGTGCKQCIPQVTEIIKETMESLYRKVSDK